MWRGKDEQDWSDLVTYAPPILRLGEKVHPKVLIDDLLRQSSADAKAEETSSAFSPISVACRTGTRRRVLPARRSVDDSWRRPPGDGVTRRARACVVSSCIMDPHGIKFNSIFSGQLRSRYEGWKCRAHHAAERAGLRPFRIFGVMEFILSGLLAGSPHRRARFAVEFWLHLHCRSATRACTGFALSGSGCPARMGSSQIYFITTSGHWVCRSPARKPRRMVRKRVDDGQVSSTVSDKVNQTPRVRAIYNRRNSVDGLVPSRGLGKVSFRSLEIIWKATRDR